MVRREFLGFIASDCFLVTQDLKAFPFQKENANVEAVERLNIWSVFVTEDFVQPVHFQFMYTTLHLTMQVGMSSLLQISRPRSVLSTQLVFHGLLVFALLSLAVIISYAALRLLTYRVFQTKEYRGWA